MHAHQPDLLFLNRGLAKNCTKLANVDDVAVNDAAQDRWDAAAAAVMRSR